MVVVVVVVYGHAFHSKIEYALVNAYNFSPPHWSDSTSFDAFGNNKTFIFTKLIKINSILQPNKDLP